MTRRLTAVSVLTMALLVVTAIPVSAATVGSIHTTDTDFNAAAELTNVSVVGTGQAAYVELDAQDSLIDSFEDNNVGEYQGDVGDWAALNGDATDGVDRLEADGATPGPIYSESGLPRYFDKGAGNYSVDVNLTGQKAGEVWFGTDTTSDSLIVRVQPNSIEFIELSGGFRSTIVNESATIPTDHYVTVEVDWDGDDSIGVEVRNQSSNALLASFATSSAVDHGDGIGFNANETGVRFDYARLTDPVPREPRGTYVSANHSVSNPADAWTNLTLTNAQAQVTWQGSNGDQWHDIQSRTYSSGGNKTVSLVDSGFDTYRVNVTFVRQSGVTVAELHDEGVFVRDENLNIWNESAPNTRVTDEVNGTFYGTENFVESGTTTTGALDITNLPTNQSYTVRLRADGYYSRRLFIENPLAEQNVYMLPTNVTSVDIVYRLDDNTGRFPPRETTLSVQRALNVSNTTTYRTIASDRFGATNEFAITLEADIRYRLVIENSEGETRVLGGYIATGDDPDAVLPIGEVNPRANTSEDVAFAAAYHEDPRRIIMTYVDPQNATTDLFLNITNVDTGTSIRANTSAGGPYGTYQETVLIPGSEPENATYSVEYVAVRDGQPNRNGSVTVGGLPDTLDRFGLAPRVANDLGWVLVIALMGLVALISAPMAIITGTGLATLLTWLGAMSVPLPLLAGAGALGVLTLVRGVSD